MQTLTLPAADASANDDMESNKVNHDLSYLAHNVLTV